MKKFLLALSILLIFINVLGKDNQEDLSVLYPSAKVVSRYHNNWTQGYFPKRIKLFKESPLEYGEIVFLGNSITQGGEDWSEKFGITHIRNRGIAGDVTDGVLHRLDEIIYFKPKAVFILIGINDLFSLHHDYDKRGLKYDKIVPSTKYVAKNIVKITKEIGRKSPDTKIFVRTLLPSRKDYLKDDILEVNAYIKQYEKKGYYTVIDLFEQFVDDEGSLTKELTKDGTHLNEKGYEKWVDFEKPIIEGL